MNQRVDECGSLTALQVVVTPLVDARAATTTVDARSTTTTVEIHRRRPRARHVSRDDARAFER